METQNQKQILKAVELGVQNKHPKFTVSSGGSEGGCCTHKKFRQKFRTLDISVPTDLDDRSRVIRWHELMHAKYSANNPHCGSIGANTTEDILVHLAGLQDYGFGRKFSHMFRSMAKVGIGDIHGNILPYLRESYPIRKLMMDNTEQAPFYRSVFLRGLSLLMLVQQKAADAKLNRVADLIVKKVAREASVMSLTASFWDGFERNLLAQGIDVLEYKAFRLSSIWKDNPMACFIEEITWLSDLASNRKVGRDYYDRLLMLVKAFVDNPPNVGKGRAKKIPEGMFVSPSTSRRVKYVENDLTHKCCTSAKPYASPSSTGSGINPGRLTKAVFGYPSVFTRRKQANKPPSAIMLDMSGSMSWTAEQMEQMCAILPAADVFIYSDRNQRRLCDGTIERIASKGRRVGEMPETGGGNGCDLQAMEKLLSFKGNVVLVSDLGFCGQSEDASKLAMDLVRQNQGRRLTVCESSEIAIAFFKERSKKGW